MGSSQVDNKRQQKRENAHPQVISNGLPPIIQTGSKHN
jgi:hypothetical protein